MILGAWCGQLGVGGWVLMGLFWATFVGLVLWALSRLFAPARQNEVLHEERTASTRHRNGRTR
jgi:hypothetical protein